MPTTEDIERFIAGRKDKLRQQFKADPGKAGELLRRYGKTDLVNAAFQGLQQGMSHGFADDVERATSGGVAKNQILAQASEPGIYALAQILGLAGTGALIRGGGATIGKARGARAAQGAGSLGASAGGAAKATEMAKRAKDIEETWAATGMKGVDPRVRGLVLDSGHGAAVGYGGQDPTDDEEALSGERLKRAGLGVLFSSIGAPLATSGGVALGNLPLLFGKRRAFSEKMLEPTGVTRQNPRGNPRQAIEIARAKDESAARFAETGSAPVGIIARDKARPIDSSARNMQQLADQALEPIAADRVAEATRRERDMAARGLLEQFPEPKVIPPPALDRSAPRGAQGDLFAEPTPARRPALPTAEDIARDRAARGERPDPMADAREAQLMRQAMRREELDARAEAPARAPAPARPATGPDLDRFVGQMMEAFTRQDRPALDSWVSTLQAAARKDPSVMRKVQARVARQLAMNERADPRLNDAPVMREFLNALGMGASKAAGRPHVLDAARGPARAANTSGRYQDAIKRMVGQPKMRPRHAETLRAEMEGYEPGAYTGPWDPRQGPATQLRGDDRARWLNPLDYLRKDKVAHADVTAAGALSGPMAFLGDQLMESFKPDGAWRDTPEPKSAEKDDRRAVNTAPPPRGLIEQLAPAEAENPVVARAAEINAPMEVKEAQQILAGAAGLPLERFGADGRQGPETTLAISRFQQAARIEVTGQLDDMTKRRLRQLRDGLLPPEMVDEIRKGLAG